MWIKSKQAFEQRFEEHKKDLQHKRVDMMTNERGTMMYTVG